MLKKTVNVGEIAPSGIPITQEMIDGANLLIDDIFKIDSIDLDKLGVERPINIHNIHPEMWGTPDVFYISNYNIYLWDYKYGYKYVDVFENWQLIAYAAGLIQGAITDILDKYIFHFTIVQPKSYGADKVRKWKIGYTQLVTYFERLRQSELKSLMPAAPCIPNPECKFCKARHACTALQNSALDALEIAKAMSPQLNNPVELSNELRLLQHTKQLLDSRITGLEAQALAEIKNGNRLPHFTVEESTGRERWTATTEDIKLMGDLHGVNLTKPIELITPKQAISKGMPEDIVQEFSETPRGQLKLVEINDKKLKNIFIDKSL